MKCSYIIILVNAINVNLTVAYKKVLETECSNVCYTYNQMFRFIISIQYLSPVNSLLVDIGRYYEL